MDVLPVSRPPILIGRSGADRQTAAAATISMPAMYLLANLLVNATAQSATPLDRRGYRDSRKRPSFAGRAPTR